MYDAIDNPLEIQSMLIAHEMFIEAIIATDAKESGNAQAHVDHIIKQVQAYCTAFKQSTIHPQAKAQADLTTKIATLMAQRILSICSHA